MALDGRSPSVMAPGAAGASILTTLGATTGRFSAAAMAAESCFAVPVAGIQSSFALARSALMATSPDVECARAGAGAVGLAVPTTVSSTASAGETCGSASRILASSALTSNG